MLYEVGLISLGTGLFVVLYDNYKIRMELGKFRSTHDKMIEAAVEFKGLTMVLKEGFDYLNRTTAGVYREHADFVRERFNALQTVLTAFIESDERLDQRITSQDQMLTALVDSIERLDQRAAALEPRVNVKPAKKTVRKKLE